MTIWVIEAGESNEGVSIVHDGDRFLVFADGAYAQAFEAFKKVVSDRIGLPSAVYSYPGEIGFMAKAHIIARTHVSDDYDYQVDVVELKPYEVIGG